MIKTVKHAKYKSELNVSIGNAIGHKSPKTKATVINQFILDKVRREEELV